MKKIERKKIIITGQVQGVGFRPFLWRMAHDFALSGFCQNTSAGVLLEIQGNSDKIENFLKNFEANLPPLARITKMNILDIPVADDDTDFRIIKSFSHAGQKILVTPDMAICADCEKELENCHNPRFQYPFINCVNCGPRYTITANLPYDRQNTTMACFALCAECRTEYENPADRRFHAQPIACPQCGPELWYINSPNSNIFPPQSNNPQSALKEACQLIISGGILALKGLGGFQLVCNAREEQIVARLRKLKNRPHKAFAIMVDNTRTALHYARLTPLQVKWLTGSKKPIVLCEKQDNPPLWTSHIAPDVKFLGIMLPYTPLHKLLFNQLKKMNFVDPCLVMTSGNIANEPICLGNREARSKLAGLCDGILFHNRDILVRVDDSVGFTNSNPWSEKERANHNEEKFRLIRRARGFVPTPVSSPFFTEKTILGMGAEQKTTFTLTRGEECFTSQHIGDLTNPAVLDFYQDTLEHLKNLLAVRPEFIVTDLHPDFLSTQFGQTLAIKNHLPIIQLQHHAAHACAVLAENNYLDTALAVCLDGSGLGTDNTIWGGEILQINLQKATWKRVGSLTKFTLPGGEMAIKEPWRIARCFDVSYLPDALTTSENAIQFLDEMLEKKINLFQTSSCGRLFDAVSARLGICEKISYEGQAAIRLEHEARNWLSKNDHSQLPDVDICLKKEDNILQLCSHEFFHKIKDIFAQTHNAGLTAAAFHLNLAKGIAQLAITLARQLNLTHIAFSGGVIQNQVFLYPMLKMVEEAKLTPLQHINLPCGDGSISYGQAIWGQALQQKQARKNREEIN